MLGMTWSLVFRCGRERLVLVEVSRDLRLWLNKVSVGSLRIPIGVFNTVSVGNMPRLPNLPQRHTWNAAALLSSLFQFFTHPPTALSGTCTPVGSSSWPMPWTLWFRKSGVNPGSYILNTYAASTMHWEIFHRFCAIFPNVRKDTHLIITLPSATSLLYPVSVDLHKYLVRC